MFIVYVYTNEKPLKKKNWKILKVFGFFDESIYFLIKS